MTASNQVYLSNMETMSNLTKKTFEPIKASFIELVDEQTFKREVSFALQVINKDQYLQKATTESKLQAVLNVAQIGLSLNPVKKEAYLISRYNRKLSVNECHLEPSYQGLVKLITDTGSVSQIYAYPVYKGDHFRVKLGTVQEIEHEPAYQSKEIERFYAVAVLHNGNLQTEVMSRADVNEIMESSESYKAYKSKDYIKSCIWVDHYSEMGRKTVLRRIVKYLPKTDQFSKLHQAIELQEQDWKREPEPGEIGMIESLLRSSSLSEDEITDIENQLFDIDQRGAWKLISYLKDNQRDPIESGDNYSQTAIRKKLSEKLADERS